jgi:hypothetical protein
MADKEDTPAIETTTERRGGVTGQNVRYVLAFGLAGVAIVFVITARRSILAGPHAKKNGPSIIIEAGSLGGCELNTIRQWPRHRAVFRA